MPDSWAAGVNFSARKLLRIAVAFFGLRVSLQEIAQVGLPGVTESVLIVVSTLVIGTWAGMKLMKLDRDTALLTAAGSAICGAAAVLAFESTLQSKPHKSAMAVGSVVLFGTLSMFLYPLAMQRGLAASRHARRGTLLRRHDSRSGAGGRRGEQREPGSDAHRDDRQDDARDAAGAGAARRSACG